MPNIRVYDDKTSDKINPSDTGYSAEEMAGRRIGPAYEELGRAQRESGRLLADQIKAEGSALEFSRFRPVDPVQGPSIRFVGGSKSGGGGGGHKATGDSSTGRQRSYQDLSQTSQGAPLLSAIAKLLAAQNKPPSVQNSGVQPSLYDSVIDYKSGAVKEQQAAEKASIDANTAEIKQRAEAGDENPGTVSTTNFPQNFDSNGNPRDPNASYDQSGNRSGGGVLSTLGGYVDSANDAVASAWKYMTSPDSGSISTDDFFSNIDQAQ